VNQLTLPTIALPPDAIASRHRSKTFAVRLDRQDQTHLLEVCDRLGLAPSDVLRRALQLALPLLDPRDFSIVRPRLKVDASKRKPKPKSKRQRRRATG
jgi:hypothetical protein